MTERALEINNEEISYKLPPQNIDAEESVLSAVLVDNQTMLEIVEILKPEDFYRSAHQKIYGAMLELFSRNEPIDTVTLPNQLEKKGALEEIGGPVYLASIIHTVPLAVNPKQYARIIHDKASLRRLIEKSNQIARKCFDDRAKVEDVIEFAERAVFEVSEGKNKESFLRLKSIIERSIEALEERQGRKTLITGVPSGFSHLDQLTSGFQPSDLIILAARPSMGKTAFALNITRNAAVEDNIPVAFFSLEMSKEQLSMRMLCSEARVDSAKIRSGYFSQEDWNKLTDAADVLTETGIYIDDSPDVSALEIRAKARRLKMEKDLGMIVIDYLQLMKVSSAFERRDLEIGDISRSLKALAKELNVPVIALSQLNRKLEERSDKRPQLSDLRESGSLEQDADVVAFIYRDEVYNKEENNPNRGKAEIIIGKQRNGPIGTSYLTFVNTYTRFENPAFGIE